MTRSTLGMCTAMALCASLTACGYRSVHGETQPERFAVVLAASSIPDAVASDEVVAGVRDELARSGALAPGAAYPRCEVEVLRADEASEGVSATRNRDQVLVPDARATSVGIVARAWIVRSKEAPRERDTGDVRAMEFVSAAPDAREATFQHVDALRSAGRRVGRRIGVHILGLPSTSD
jgi:hypothetical protein